MESQETAVSGRGGREISAGRIWLCSRSAYVSSASAYHSLICWSFCLFSPSQIAEDSAGRDSSTRFATGGGDERVAFKFRARHAHWLTVTRQVTDRQRSRLLAAAIAGLSVGRWGLRSVDGEGFARAGPALPPVCRQSTPSGERDRVTRHVTAGILISVAGSPAAEAEAGRRDDVSTAALNNTPRYWRHAPHSSAV